MPRWDWPGGHNPESIRFSAADLGTLQFSLSLSLCRGYTPQLSQAYTDSSKKDKTAIIFVSSDQDQNGFDEYYGEMSFFALPYREREKKAALSDKYGVQGIPTLVLLNGSGELVNGNIRGSHADYL